MTRGLQHVLAMVLMVVVLAACGQNSQPTATPTIARTPTAATTTTAAAAAASTPSVTSTPAQTATLPATVTARATSTAAATQSTAPATPMATPAPATPTALPVTVTDATGKQVTIQDVSRIVPVNGDIAEIVWTLGLGDRIVGVDTSATYPPDLLKKLPHVGYQRQLSAEGILSLKPTVVIGTPLAGPPQVLEQIRAAGVPVVIVENPVSIDAPLVKIRQVARALGVPDRGEALATQVANEIKEAQALAAKATSHPRVVYIHSPGAHEAQVAGTGTAAHVMIEAAGAIDAAAAAGIQGYKTLTAEAMTAAAPDYILMFDNDLAATGGIDGLLQLPGIAQTPAGQHRAVLSYEAQYALGMGPRTGQALRTLVLALHPELGKSQ